MPRSKVFSFSFAFASLKLDNVTWPDLDMASSWFSPDSQDLVMEGRFHTGYLVKQRSSVTGVPFESEVVQNWKRFTFKLKSETTSQVQVYVTHPIPLSLTSLLDYTRKMV